MGQIRVPASPTYYTTYYRNLKGVDFSQDMSEVDKTRTPDGLNMISDDGGNPVKRLGWRVVKDLNCGKIFEIIFHEDDETDNDRQKIYVIGQTGIFAVTTKNGAMTQTTMLSKAITSARYYMFNGEVFAFINSGLYKLHGVTASGIEDSAYVPEAVISKNPDGSGGQSLEAVNLLTQTRIFSFLGDETSKDFYLYASNLREQDEYKYVVYDSIKVEKQTTAGWEEVTFTKPTPTTITALDESGTEVSFSVCEGKVTFTAAQPPLVTGQDNIRITFKAFNNKAVGGKIQGTYKEERVDLLKTTACMTYGYEAIDRVFLVGGVNKNKVYYSDVNEPMYFPDENYITVGHDSNGIVGLHRVGDSLAAIKNDSAVEGTVFLIRGAYLDSKMYFGVTPTSAGIGAIAPKTFVTLIDEPMFLTRDGIFAIANYYVTSEKVLRNRSYLVDKRLLKEKNLENACSTVWQRYCLTAVNGHCYVLDGRNKAKDQKNNTDFLYEAYYWENIPAATFCVEGDELYFGTADGKLCKFNTDGKDRTVYCDNGTPTVNSDGTVSLSEGVAIPCRWSTPLDDDGKPQYYKTLSKKGNVLTMLPYVRTSAQVTLMKDGEKYISLKSFYADMANWEVIDFSRLSFLANNTAQDSFFNKKVNRYKRLMITVENDTIYEPFGILGITKTYFIKNFSKR